MVTIDLNENLPDLQSIRNQIKKEDIILTYKGVNILVMIDPKKYQEQINKT